MVYGKMFFHIILTPNIFYAFWQMLCLLVSKADVICLADVNALYVLGDVIAKSRCYSSLVFMADVIAIYFMADVIAIFVVLTEFLFQYIATMILADVIAMW